MENLNDLNKLFHDKLKENNNDYEKAFEAVAEYLFKNFEFRANGYTYYFTVLQFHYHSADHPDGNVQQNPKQLTTDELYFHNGGMHKGVDITFGNRADNEYGGILIKRTSCGFSNDLCTPECGLAQCSFVDTILRLKKFGNYKNDENPATLNGKANLNEYLKEHYEISIEESPTPREGEISSSVRKGIDRTLEFADKEYCFTFEKNR
jgi:hypothetical protein